MAIGSALETLNQKNPEHKEGDLTQKIENQTAKIPSVGYLSLAVGSILISASLAVFAEKKTFANFVGLWAPTFLLLGIYNKLVKLEGSDKTQQGNQNFQGAGFNQTAAY